MIVEVGLGLGVLLLLRGGGSPDPVAVAPRLPGTPPPMAPARTDVAAKMGAKRVVSIGIPPQLTGTAKRPYIVPRLTPTGVYPLVTSTPMIGQVPKPVVPRMAMISPPFMGRR